MPHLRTIALLSLAFLLLPLPAARASSPEAARAVALYDAGNYVEARKLLEKLEAAGKATGPLLYRLAFTLNRAGEKKAGTAMEQKALTRLEAEFADRIDLEVAFYLANAYRNRKQPERGKEVALRYTDALQSESVATPTGPLERFRVGKLYADQGRTSEAATWYREALAGLEKDESYPAYQDWIRRFLFGAAFDRGDWKSAMILLEHHLARTEGNRTDYDRLAVLQGRTGSWDRAIETWRKVERMNPADGDRARYCRQLITRAREVGTLPRETFEGEPIEGLDKDRMEEILKETAAEAKEARADGEKLLAQGDPGGETTKQQAAARQEQLDRLKPLFVAVALEYAYQGGPIRQTAFFGGYAPLIFHADQWEVPGLERKPVRSDPPGRRSSGS